GTPKRNAELAQKAVALVPEDGTIWLGLGMAQYRAGNSEAALESMEKGMTLRNGGDPSDWFGVALVQCKRGDQAKATQWYEKANEWMQSHEHPAWWRLRAEAASLLGRVSIVRRLEGHEEAIHGLALSANGNRAVI